MNLRDFGVFFFRNMRNEGDKEFWCNLSYKSFRRCISDIIPYMHLRNILMFTYAWVRQKMHLQNLGAFKYFHVVAKKHMTCIKKSSKSKVIIPPGPHSLQAQIKEFLKIHVGSTSRPDLKHMVVYLQIHNQIPLVPLQQNNNLSCMEFKETYFSSLRPPKFPKTKKQVINFDRTSSQSESFLVNFTGGLALCCDAISESYVIQDNVIFFAKVNEKVVS